MFVEFSEAAVNTTNTEEAKNFIVYQVSLIMLYPDDFNPKLVFVIAIILFTF